MLQRLHLAVLLLLSAPSLALNWLSGLGSGSGASPKRAGTRVAITGASGLIGSKVTPPYRFDV